MRFRNGLLQLKNKPGILLGALSLDIAMTAILSTYFEQMIPVWSNREMDVCMYVS